MEVLLCKPKYFDVPETDEQNKFMDPKDRPNLARACRQHASLVTLYKRLGIKTKFISPEQGLVDMPFTANAGFTFSLNGQKSVILANFKPDRRRGETIYHQQFFEREGYNIFTLPKNIFFEGAGDLLPYRAPGETEKILMGYGHRTSFRAIPYIEKTTEREVVPLKLSQEKINGKFAYHLDITTIVLEEERSFILYPKFLTHEAQRNLEAIGEIYTACIWDALDLALNAVVIPRALLGAKVQEDFKFYKGIVLTSAHASSNLIRRIYSFGYYPWLVDISEFLKSGGGVLCLTKILEP